MAESIPVQLIIEKNKLASPNPWLVLLDFTIDEVDCRYVDNNADIRYDGDLYTATSFSVEISKDTSKGELPSITLAVSNVDRIIGGYVEDVGGGLGIDVTISVVNIDVGTASKVSRSINSVTRYFNCVWAHISSTVIDRPVDGPFWSQKWQETYDSTGAVAWADGTEYNVGECYLAFQKTYTVLNSTITSKVLSFNLGAPNLLRQRHPRHRYIASSCRWMFKYHECKYEDATASVVYHPDSGKNYICIKSHTSSSTNKPEESTDSWMEYWRRISPSTGAPSAWAADTVYNHCMRVSYSGSTYVCLKKHKSVAGSTPDGALMTEIWKVVSDRTLWTTVTSYTSGTATCKLNIGDCRKNGNLVNFGGFRGLSESIIRRV